MGYRSEVQVIIESPKIQELCVEFFLLNTSNQAQLN